LQAQQRLKLGIQLPVQPPRQINHAYGASAPPPPSIPPMLPPPQHFLPSFNHFPNNLQPQSSLASSYYPSFTPSWRPMPSAPPAPSHSAHSAGPSFSFTSPKVQHLTYIENPQPPLSGIHPGYSCKEGRIVEDGLLVEFPCTHTRTRSVYSY
jgi:hypothetical protein